MLELLSAQEITEFIIIVLLAYHMREAERLEHIIQEAGQKNCWNELWPRFQKASENDEMALSHFAQFIMAQMDGGNYAFPDGVYPEILH